MGRYRPERPQRPLTVRSTHISEIAVYTCTDLLCSIIPCAKRRMFYPKFIDYGWAFWPAKVPLFFGFDNAELISGQNSFRIFWPPSMAN